MLHFVLAQNRAVLCYCWVSGLKAVSFPSLAELYISSGSLVGCQRFSSLAPGQDRQELPQ